MSKTNDVDRLVMFPCPFCGAEAITRKWNNRAK